MLRGSTDLPPRYVATVEKDAEGRLESFPSLNLIPNGNGSSSKMFVKLGDLDASGSTTRDGRVIIHAKPEPGTRIGLGTANHHKIEYEGKIYRMVSIGGYNPFKFYKLEEIA